MGSDEITGMNCDEIATALLAHGTTRGDGRRAALSVGATADRRHVGIRIGEDGPTLLLGVAAAADAIGALRDALRIVQAGGAR